MSSKYWDRAWSLVDRCTPVSEACDHCWLHAMGNRFGKQWDRTPIVREDKIDLPLRIKKPTTWAVWSDLFHYCAVPEEFIIKAFEVMSLASQHTFIVLTKRPARAHYVLYEYDVRYLGGGDYIPNVWFGTTVEKGIYAGRIDLIRRCYPHNLFLSVEPMLGPLPELDLEHIKLVICGCESGPCARKTKIDWIRELRDQCLETGVMFYLKQMEIDGKVVHLPELDGVVYDKLPWRN